MKKEKANCVFCRIVAGIGPVSLIYQDDKVIVFPVLQPVNPGHIIVVPRRHASSFQEMDEDTAGHVMKIARKMAQAIRESSFRCEGINLFLADGKSAGQEVFHFHLHVYPRFAADGFGFKYDKSKHFVQIDQEQMDRVAAEIERHLE